MSRLIEENCALKALQEVNLEREAKLSRELDQWLEETESQQKVLEGQIYALVTKKSALVQEVEKSRAVAKENETLKRDLIFKQCRIANLEERVKEIGWVRSTEKRASSTGRVEPKKTVEEIQAKELQNEIEKLRMEEEGLKKEITLSGEKNLQLEERGKEVRRALRVAEGRLKLRETRLKQLLQNL